MNNQIQGKYGEDRAVSYLRQLGFEILERNYRFKRSEIDLIALWQNELLVFVEVKNRKNSQFGEPESFVTTRQERKIKEAAEDYVYGINWTKDIRFDILAVQSEEVVHFKDAF